MGDPAWTTSALDKRYPRRNAKPEPGEAKRSRPPLYVLNRTTYEVSGPFKEVERYERDRNYLISFDAAILGRVADELREYRARADG
jgi:hypothetical protein